MEVIEQKNFLLYYKSSKRSVDSAESDEGNPETPWNVYFRKKEVQKETCKGR